MSVIHVDFRVVGTKYLILKALKELEQYDVLGFDTETRGVYPRVDREEAHELLKSPKLDMEHQRVCRLVANNNGLSYPSLVSVTHFVFGISESQSVIIITDTPHLEMLVWKWVAAYKGLLVIHNTLFDLKIMYHRVKCLPQNYEDSVLIIKAYINNADTWKARVGLKDLMAEYYDPGWTLIDGYEPENLRDPAFLRYTAIDGAAVRKLWDLILEQRANG